MSRQPVAYIRRSKVDTANPGDVSRATQDAAIRALAGADAANLVILEDWGKSGRGAKRHLRTEYGRLLAMIAADQVSTVYSYNLSRLGRSTRDVRELAELCAAHDTAIRLADGQNVDGRTATGRMLLDILSAVDEWQAEVQVERTMSSIAAWREAHPGESLGQKNYGEAPGESVQAVLDAFSEVGSFLGTAKLLTARGVPTRSGGPWETRSVSRIVRRERVVPAKGTRGVRARSTRLFARLLRCHCGDTLTSMSSTKRRVRYYCRRAHQNLAHSRPYIVGEGRLLPWMMAEAARLPMESTALPSPGKVRWLAGSDVAMSESERTALEGRRGSIEEAFASGVLNKAERAAKLNAIDVEIAVLDSYLFRPSHVTWDAPVDAVNAQLRAIWDYVELGTDLLPVRAEWWMPI